MAYLNNISIMGRLTADPELKSTQSGKHVVSFNIAVDGYGERTDFFRATAWDKTADIICKYFRKGAMIVLDGNLTNNNYTANDGTERKTTEINIHNAYFCGSKANDTPNAEKPENKPVEAEWTTPDNEPGNEDDLPF